MIIGNKVRLREKRLSDAHQDYAWQTNPELAQLDANPLLTTSFPAYLLDYSSQLQHPTPNRHPLAVETTDGEHIGNCMYYNVDETRGKAEIGIMIGAGDYRDKGYGTDAITTLVNHIFLETRLKRLYLKTLDWNQRAQRCFQKCGFTPCGRLNRDGYNFLLMELHHDQWEARQRELKTVAQDG